MSEENTILHVRNEMKQGIAITYPNRDEDDWIYLWALTHGNVVASD
jgi:hypothetical protein